MKFNDIVNEYLNIIGEETAEDTLDLDAVEEEETVSPDIKLEFSPGLSEEFTNTVNEFTTICAKMVKLGKVDDDTFKTYNDLYNKLKHLVESAQPVE
jgi:hypothetical protein